MMDNSLKLSFDFKSTSEAALVVYKTTSSYFSMGEPLVTIIQTFTGQEAIEIYSRITGKSIEDITKEAQNE